MTAGEPTRNLEQIGIRQHLADETRKEVRAAKAIGKKKLKEMLADTKAIKTPKNLSPKGRHTALEKYDDGLLSSGSP